MALADYFLRNAQAASSLLRGLDTSLLRSRLEREVIAIMVDASVPASAEACAAVDLSVRLVSRLYPALALVGARDTPPEYIEGLRVLATAINPKIALTANLKQATRALVFGNTRLPTRSPCVESVWYVGSDNWIARLSRQAPVVSGRSRNPLGAGAAACLAVANLFRAVFADEVGKDKLDAEVSVSLFDLQAASAEMLNPKLGKVVFSDVHLAGAGAIGNGFLWAIARLPCSGTLHVVDPEAVTDSNLQRYVMLSATDAGKEKAVLAGSWLGQNRRLRVKAHVSDWTNHVCALVDHKADTVVCAVDSAAARIGIQASLPRQIYNSWTQSGEAGISRHQFLGEMACMACLYIPQGNAENLDQLVVRALRLPDGDAMLKEVRRRLQQGTPTERGFIELISTNSGVHLEILLPFENRPLQDLYVRGVCGGAIMEFHTAALQARADVPMGFQSALAGILLAAELARSIPVSHTMTQIDLLAKFPEYPNHYRRRSQTTPCICSDEDFIAIYRNKYSEPAVTDQCAKSAGLPPLV